MRAFAILIFFLQLLAFSSAEAKAPDQPKEATGKVSNLSAYKFHGGHPVEFVRPAAFYRSTNTVKDFRHLTGLAFNTTLQGNFPQDVQKLSAAGTVYPRKLLLRLLLFPDHYFW